jgi:hypothetical protein
LEYEWKNFAAILFKNPTPHIRIATFQRYATCPAATPEAHAHWKL